MNSLSSLGERLDQLTLKERVLVLVAGVLVAGLTWHSLVLQPLALERAKVMRALDSGRTSITETQTAIATVKANAAKDPNNALRNSMNAARQQILAFEQEIKTRAGELIPPNKTTQVLQSVLQDFQGLGFVALEGLGAKSLLNGDADGAPKGGAADAYRHGFKISFSGSYLATIDYLRALESLPWRFFWDSVHLQVSEHPEAYIEVTVYTLSLDSRWIGV
ncbi:MAG: type II secretion system protein GspM [Pseudomonadota bacterium]